MILEHSKINKGMQPCTTIYSIVHPTDVKKKKKRDGFQESSLEEVKRHHWRNEHTCARAAFIK